MRPSKCDNSLLKSARRDEKYLQIHSGSKKDGGISNAIGYNKLTNILLIYLIHVHRFHISLTDQETEVK